MIRTFLAVDFDDGFLDEVAALADRLRAVPRLSAARWAARETLHTTARFFGDTDDRQLAALRALVHELAANVTALPVRAPSVHGFPERARAHVLVLDIADFLDEAAGAPGATLASLAARAEARAVSLGFAAESRPYHAHLTLARMRKAVDVTSLTVEAALLPPGRATAITLYASSSSPNGAVYTPLERAPLA
jgi:2'-5' RNA ligase